MVPLFAAAAVVLALGDVVLWLRYLRPTDVVWERRNRLIAASLGVIPPLLFVFIVVILITGSR